ncbi:MAG: hypothetical protein ABSE40_14855, partial [Candidatus Sulfotelmatobacter sp.]
SVVTVVLERVQLAPLVAGAENVTVRPLAAVPLDVTFATSGLVNAVPTAALCPPPLTAVINMVGAALVRPKLAGVVAPVAVAVTL